MRLNRCTVAVAALCAVPLLTTRVAAQQQAGAPAAMELSTTSDAARSEYRKAFTDFLNTNPGGARRHAMTASQADPNFGVALALLSRAAVSPELSVAERNAVANRAVAATANASAVEVLIALFTREQVAGRNAVANELIKSAAALAPNDPEIQWLAYFPQRATASSPADLARMDREFLSKFDYGPAHNLLAYTLAGAGDFAGAYDELGKYVRASPEQPNAHDSWADILILENRFEEAARHLSGATRIDSTWPGTPLKLGAIQLAQGKADSARLGFARARDMGQYPAQRIEPAFWIVTSYIVAHDAKSARRELDAIGQIVSAGNLPAAAQALLHDRMAFAEAYIGDKNAAAPHLARATELLGNGAATNAAHQVFSTFVYAAMGDAAQAQTAADAYMKAAPTNNAGHTLQALAAVTAKNYNGAAAHLGASNPNDLLAAELKAEVAKQQGKAADAKAAKEAVLKRAVKQDGNSNVDVTKVVARLRAEKL
jgi:hypothetical protein